ncbi:MAG: glycosyltransferase family 4 protein [Candidatus Omnitrophota bacterium]
MRQKIKVLRIIARLNVGGPAIHTILLTSALNDAEYASVLVCGNVDRSEKDMSYLADTKGVKPVIIPELCRSINPVKDLRAFIAIFRAIKEFKPDIVHTHTAKAGALGRAAAVLAGVPVRIHTFHGHIFDGYFSKLQAAVFLAIERVLACFTKYIIVVSEAQKSDIAEKYRIAGENKIKVVPLGLELEKYAAIGGRDGNLRKELGIGDGAVLVSIIGRLVPVKNHRMFVDAAKIALSGTPAPDMRFVIVGDGEERTELEAYAAGAGLEGRIVFHGWKEDMAGVYADSDIVALTSLNEGTPVALIEALASGRPVVSTDVGGVRDVVQDGRTGYLVASGDARTFAGKLCELAADSSKRASFGAAGKASVMGKYSSERLISDIKRLYTDSLIDYNKGKKGV